MPKPLWAPWRLEYIEHADERIGCIFCDPEPEVLVREGELALAVLNKYPYAPGHVMVAPRRHVGSYLELTEPEAHAIHDLTTQTLEALGSAYEPQGFNVGWNLGRAGGAAIVDHVHEHVVPRWLGDTNFMPVLADTRVLPEALTVSAQRLREAWPA
jgi:ATP adenylyltransferase